MDIAGQHHRVARATGLHDAGGKAQADAQFSIKEIDMGMAAARIAIITSRKCLIVIRFQNSVEILC